MNILSAAVRPPSGFPLLLVTLATTFPAIGSAQTTLRVPSQYATVQAAVNAAPPGATVLIAPGTYAVTNLDPGGRAIVVRGELGAQQTILDANRLGRVAHVHRGEGSGLVFEGLTFRGGLAPINQTGGGMLIEGFAAPRIVDCVFDQNEGAVGGAAVGVEGGAGLEAIGCQFTNNVGGAFSSQSDAPLRFANCTFTGNQDWTMMNVDGAFGGRLELQDCVFADNTPASYLLRLRDVTCSLLRCTLRDNQALSCLRLQPRQPFQTVRVEQCNLTRNQCTRSVCEALYSGSAPTTHDPVWLRGCTFADNTLSSAARSCLWVVEANCRVEGCTFARNSSSFSSTVLRVEGLTTTIGSTHFTLARCRVVDNLSTGRSMIAFALGTATVENSLFANNVAGSGPSVLINALGRPVDVRHCTFVDNAVNTSGTSGPAVQDVSTLTSCILYGNTPQQIGGTTTATHCDVEGGYPGTGNFDANPLLVGNGPHPYRLGVGSPCLDAGAPGSSGTDTDLDGQPRRLGTAPDVGCDESPAQPLPGTDGDLLLTTTIDGQGNPLGAQKQAQAGQQVEVRVQSMTGQLVGARTFLVGEVRATGAPPPAVPLVPGMHVDAFSPTFFVAFDSATIGSPLGAPGLPAQGIALAFSIPLGLSGDSLHLQAGVITTAAANGIYEASNSHEVVLP